MMKVLSTFLLSISLIILSAFNPPGDEKEKNKKTYKENREGWQLDKEHTKIGFTATHLLISEVEGVFHDYDLDLSVNDENFVNSQFSLIIKAASVDTDSRSRDEHLRSKDFFNVEKHPEIRFESTMMKWDGNKRFKLKGYLTINGVKRLETFEMKYGGKIIDPIDGYEKAGFKITGVINRYDYNLRWNISSSTAESFAVSEEVELECNLRLKRIPETTNN